MIQLNTINTLSSFSICGKIMVQVFFFKLYEKHMKLIVMDIYNKFYIANRSKNDQNL